MLNHRSPFVEINVKYSPINFSINLYLTIGSVDKQSKIKIFTNFDKSYLIS